MTSRQRPALGLPAISSYRHTQSPTDTPPGVHAARPLSILGRGSSGPGAIPQHDTSSPHTPSRQHTDVVPFSPLGSTPAAVPCSEPHHMGPRGEPHHMERHGRASLGDDAGSQRAHAVARRMNFTSEEVTGMAAARDGPHSSPGGLMAAARAGASGTAHGSSNNSGNGSGGNTSIAIHVVTYNMAGVLPRTLPTALFCPQQGTPVADLVVIGTQESCSLGDWEKLVCKQLGPAFHKVAQESLMSISLLVFAHNKIAGSIRDVQTSSVACGIGNMLGNKGGVGVSCCVAGARLLLITSHLAAHDEFVDRRNSDYQRIYTGLFGAASTTGNIPVPAAPNTSGTSTPKPFSGLDSPQRGTTSVTSASGDPLLGSGLLMGSPSNPMSPTMHPMSPGGPPAMHSAHSARVSRLVSCSSMAQLPQPAGLSRAASAASGLATMEGTPRSDSVEGAPLQGSPQVTGDLQAARTLLALTMASSSVDGAVETPRGSAPTTAPPWLSVGGCSGAWPSPGKGGSVVPLHDAVVWCGDLNYRINATSGLVQHLLDHDMWEVLHANDQLRIQMRKGKAFQGFHEQAINFPPTFKYKPHTCTYSDKRVPSWTDRILTSAYHTHEVHCALEPLYYTHVPELRDSDHRPVVAGYELHIHKDLAPPAERRKRGGPCVIS